jgi:hypothetical protein
VGESGGDSAKAEELGACQPGVSGDIASADGLESGSRDHATRAVTTGLPVGNVGFVNSEPLPKSGLRESSSLTPAAELVSGGHVATMLGYPKRRVKVFEPPQPERGHDAGVKRGKSPRYDAELFALVAEVEAWIERDFGGNVSKAAEACGLSRSLTHDLRRYEPRVSTLRSLVPYVPDAVAALVGVSSPVKRRGKLWPNLEKALTRIRPDASQVAYARYLNDFWEFDRPTGEWARELMSYAEASETDVGHG